MLNKRTMVLGALVLVLIIGVAYMLDNTLFGLLRRKEGFENSAPEVIQTNAAASMNGQMGGAFNNAGNEDVAQIMGNQHMVGGGENSPMMPNPNGEVTEGFETLSPAPMPFAAAEKPANCYPKNQLAAQELLPGDPNTVWAQVNPQSSGDIAGKNFLNAGALIGVDTVGQSLRNASHDLRSEVPNPQVQVSPWMNSTITADLQRRPLEIA
jgi:hypothetical protein